MKWDLCRELSSTPINGSLMLIWVVLFFAPLARAGCNYDPRGAGTIGHVMSHPCDELYNSSSIGPGAKPKCERLTTFLQCLSSSVTGCTASFASLMCAAKDAADPDVCPDAETRCGKSSSCTFPVLTQGDMCIRSLDQRCLIADPAPGECWFNDTEHHCVREVKRCFWVCALSPCSAPFFDLYVQTSAHLPHTRISRSAHSEMQSTCAPTSTTAAPRSAAAPHPRLPPQAFSPYWQPSSSCGCRRGLLRP